MAYQTGQVASASAIITTIQDFCVSNGWTISGSGWLYKGNSNVKLAAASSNVVTIQPATDNTGSNAFAYKRTTYITAWPATYHLFVHTNPDQVVMVLNYNSLYIQTIMFGDLVKVHDSAYVGGNWCYASGPSYVNGGSSLAGIANFFSYGSGVNYPGIYNWTDSTSGSSNPFPESHTTGYDAGCCTIPFIGHYFNAEWSNYCPVHMEIDGNIWTGTTSCYAYLSSTTVRLAWAGLSSWNQQALLVPMHLKYNTPAGPIMNLGFIEHIRLVRVTNYQIGDIITLGSDHWKVFPWHYKNASYPNGASETLAGTGTHGFAVRYDGPL